MGDPSDIEELLAKAKPYRERLDTLTEAQTAVPWYRRAIGFLGHAQKFLVVFGSICAASVAAHAWIAGLVTTNDVKTAVSQAVAETMLDTRARVTVLEDRTAGLPEWRRDTQEMITRHDERIKALGELSARTSARVDGLGRKAW